MTNTPNNIAGEEWISEFDKEFRFNSHVLAQDGNYEGTELRTELLAFIHATLRAAIAGERNRATDEIAQMFVNMLARARFTNQTVGEKNDYYLTIAQIESFIRESLKALTPNPDTSKES